jgi:predicted phosphoribosyltransferase
MFEDRADAGRRLADLVTGHDYSPALVVGIAPGGIVVGRAVADELDRPLTVVTAEKYGAPDHPEVTVGAAAADGSDWVNDVAVAEFGVSESYLLERQRETAETARDALDHYRGGRPGPDMTGRSVLVVDDGVATGATAIACLRMVRSAGADEVALGVPVAAERTVERLRSEADAVLAIETPPHFQAVSQFYDEFEDVDDAKAVAALARD